MLIQIEVSIYSKEGKKDFTTEYSAECHEDGFYIDMLRFFDQTKLVSQKEMDMEIEGDYLSFPKQMNEGDDLQDGEVSIHISYNGKVHGTMTMEITDRKVLGKEKITTPAGTFDCYKISHTYHSYFGNSRADGTSIDWFAKNIGTVKSEFYNTAGTLISYTELTSEK